MIVIWMPVMWHPSLARAGGVVVIAGGVGLISGQRWAWPIGLSTAVAVLAVSIILCGPPEETFPLALTIPENLLLLTFGGLLLSSSLSWSTLS